MDSRTNWELRVIGKEEGRGELFSGNFGKSSKRPSLKGRRRWQGDIEGRQDTKNSKKSILTFRLVLRGKYDKNCIKVF